MSESLNARAVMGGNHPPMALVDYAPVLTAAAVHAQLTAEYAPGAERTKELKAGVANFANVYPDGLQNQSDAEAATDFVAQIKKHASTLEATRVKVKGPFLEAGKQIDTYFGNDKKLMDGRAAHLETAYLTPWARKVAAERQAAAAAEAKRLQDEADKLAAEAAASVIEADVNNAVVALNKADVAVRKAEAPAAAFSRERGVSGATSGLRKQVVITLTDPTLVPPEYWVVDMVKARADLTRAVDPVSSIPGITVTHEFVAKVRA